MKYTFEIKRASSIFVCNKDHKPHEKAFWSEEFQTWLISFEDLVEFIEFVKGLNGKFNPYNVIVDCSPTVSSQTSMDLIIIYDGYVE